MVVKGSLIPIKKTVSKHITNLKYSIKIMVPSPKFWLKSLGLFGYNLPSLFIVGIVSRYYAFYGLLIVNPNIWVLICGLLGILTYCLSFAYLHFWLWGKPDPNPKHLKWLPSNQSLKIGFVNLNVSLLSYGLMILLLFPFIGDLINADNWLAGLSFMIWIVSATYIFYLISLVSNKKKITK